MSSCKKDDPWHQTFEEGIYEVGFAPRLFGEVVPWVKKDNSKGLSTKGFNEFEHKYFEHVIRIFDVSNTWVADIPITDEGTAGSGNYVYELNTGQYTAVVIPVLEDDASTVQNALGTPYTMVDLASSHSFNKAPFYTGSPVQFIVAGPTSVQLNCVTDFGSFQFDNKGDYVSLGTPIPEVLLVDDAAFIANHQTAGSEQASFSQLQAITPVAVMDPTVSDALSVGTTVANGFWWDTDAGADLYYLYMVPGSSIPISRTLDPGAAAVELQNAYPSYLAFDVAGGGGAANPTLWLLDYYGAAQWGANTTLRVIFDGQGDITVIQMDWFSNIISIGGTGATTDLVATATYVPEAMVDIEISGGTSTYTVEFFTDAGLTTYATVGGVDAIFTDVPAGTNQYGAFATGQKYIQITDSDVPSNVITTSVFVTNDDIAGVDISIDGLDLEVTSVNYVSSGSFPTNFSPWTYEWYATSSDANDQTNLLGTGSTFTTPSTGTYFVRTTDGAGQYNITSAVSVDPYVAVLTNVGNNGGTGATRTYYVHLNGGDPLPDGATVTYTLSGSASFETGDPGTTTVTSINIDISGTGNTGTITATVHLSGGTDVVSNVLTLGPY